MAVFVLLEALLFSFFLACSGAPESVPEPLNHILVDGVKDFCYNPDPLVRDAIHCHKINEGKAEFDAQNVKRATGTYGIVLFANITPPASGLRFNELQLPAGGEHPQPVKIDTPTEVAVKIHYREPDYERFLRSLRFHAQPKPFHYSLMLAASNIGPPQYQLVKEGEVEPLFPDYEIAGKIEGPTTKSLIDEMLEPGAYGYPPDQFLALGNMVSIPLVMAEALDFIMPKGIWHCSLHALNVMWMKPDAKECETLRRAGSLRVWKSKKSGICIIFDRAYVRIIDTDYTIKVDPEKTHPCAYRPNDLFRVVEMFEFMRTEVGKHGITPPGLVYEILFYIGDTELLDRWSATEQNNRRARFVSDLKRLLQKLVRDKFEFSAAAAEKDLQHVKEK